MTYEEIKNANELKIVDWFEINYDWSNRYYVETRRVDISNIVRETEKAVLVRLALTPNGEYFTHYNFWIPKKCFESVKDYETACKKAEEERIARIDAGLERYEKLVAFCKEHNVAGARNRMKTSTLMDLIAKAGLVYEA